MKNVCLAIIAASVATSVYATSATSTSEQQAFATKAQQYFTTTRAQHTFEQGVVTGLRNTLTRGHKNPAADALAEKLAQQFFAWQPLQQKFIQVMQDTLTVKDVDNAIAFYQTDSGKKMVALEPIINLQSVQYIQGALRKHSPQIEAAVNQTQFTALLQRAQSDKANALTQATLGELYLKGIGTKPSAEQAAPWLKKAAKRGNPMAQAELAKLYDLGKGVKANPTRAVIWYHRAANQGDTNAMYQIARHFSKGIGVPKDAKKAAQWYLDSAMRSNVCAKYAIGMDYVKGNGVKKSKQLAKAWLSSFAEMAYFSINPHAKLKNIYDISKAYADFEVDDHGDSNQLKHEDMTPAQASAVSDLQQHAHKICV
ncbi:MAG: DUF2059 domain-containing protein [Coxiellaceae bacterium]|nr:DUF2059 domain-containing protein [Coxiellaceae bacterium]